MKRMPDSEWLQRQSYFNPKIKKCIVNGNKEKECTYCKFHFSFN